MFRYLSICVLPAVALLLAMPAWSGAAPESIDVPSVSGKTDREAIALLEAAGLKVRVIQVVGPAVGKVATQDPVAGADVAPGALVTLRVGTRTGIKTTMPDVLGQSAEDALETLTIAYDVHVQRTPGAAAKAGTVVRTEPPAGKELWLRGKVMIYVVSGTAIETAIGTATGMEPERNPEASVKAGPEPSTKADPESSAEPDSEPEEPGPALGTPVNLPDLTGKKLADARKIVKRLGLMPNVLRVLEPEAQPDTVVMQVPGGPVEALAGDVVWLRVAQGAPDKGPEKAATDGSEGAAKPDAPDGDQQVPALVGLNTLAASQEIVRRGLLPHPWYVTRAGHREWEVLAQKDPPGTTIPRGGIVHFRTALPPHRNGPISMPYLYGLTAKQATQVLQGLGLPAKGRILNMSGRVTLQHPQAGDAIAWGAHVTLTVGKVTDAEAAAKVPLVTLIPDNTPIPPVAPARKKDGNILDEVGSFFEKLFD